LKKVRDDLSSKGVSVFFTPGKEIENLFLAPSTIQHVIPKEHIKEFETRWDEVFKSERIEAYGSYVTLHQKFLSPKLDIKTVTTKFTPLFDKTWADKKTRHRIIEGKKALHHLRAFYREKAGSNLTTQKLIQAVVKGRDAEAKGIVGQALGCLRKKKQILHY